MAVVSVGWSLLSLAVGDKLVLVMASARQIDKADALNAFATGQSVQRGTIAVTRGLVNTLSRDELQGVVAHEMAHIANLDTRYMVMVGVTVGLIALVCDMLLRTLNWGGSARNRSRSGKRRKGSGGGLLIILLLVVAILAPLAAKAVQFAVSRQREYLADATSVQFTRNPNGLISALGKLAEKAAPFPGVSHATQHLFIVNPVQEFTKDTPALLATHPDIQDRIARLRNLGG